MESVICKSLLWKFGLATREEYIAELDRLYKKKPELFLLLELDDCSDDCDRSFERMKKYWKYHFDDVSLSRFGECLCQALETAYYSGEYDFEEFSFKSYLVWSALPHGLHKEEPYFFLSEADDCIAMSEDDRAKNFYQRFFDYYK